MTTIVSSNHLEYGYDIDMFSVQVRLEDIPLLQQLYTLAVKRNNPKCDKRVGDFVQVCGAPFCLFARATQTHLLDAFLSIGISIQPNADPTVLGRLRRRPLPAGAIIAALRLLDVSHVVVFCYGIKHRLGDNLQSVLETLALDGGGHNNVFDLAITTPSANSFILHKLKRSAAVQGDTYPLFKALGDLHGSVEFMLPAFPNVAKVKTYSMIAGFMKSFKKLNFPKKNRDLPTISHRLKHCLDQFILDAHLYGGYRTEYTIIASSLMECRDHLRQFPWPSDSLSKIEVAIADIVSQAEHGFELATNLGVFVGSSPSANISRRKIFVFNDLMNMIGWSTAAMQMYLRNSGIACMDRWQYWFSFRSRQNLAEIILEQIPEMRQRIKVRRGLRGGFAVTLNGRPWGAFNNPEAAIEGAIAMIVQRRMQRWRSNIRLIHENTDSAAVQQRQRRRSRLVFSEEQDALLQSLVSTHGNRWSFIHAAGGLTLAPFNCGQLRSRMQALLRIRNIN